MNYSIFTGLIVISTIMTTPTCAQRVLSMEETVELAKKHSINSEVSLHTFYYNEWNYKYYRASRKPTISLSLTPVQYYSDIVQRYSYEENRDVYRSQKYLYSYSHLLVQQNVDWTGGLLYIDSELNYYHTFGSYSGSQFTSVPIRIGYSQDILGYNPLKWEKKLQPLKYETAKKTYIYSLEETAETAIQKFYLLASLIAKEKLAKENSDVCDTLYNNGVTRNTLNAISKADLLTLKLEKANAENDQISLMQQEINERMSLASFLSIPIDSPLSVKVNYYIPDINIPMDKALELVRHNSPDILAACQNIMQGEQNVDQTRKNRYLDGSFSASIGLNQEAEAFNNAYNNPMTQQTVKLTLTIPLTDFGQKKSLYNRAKEDLETAKSSAKLKEKTLEEELVKSLYNLPIQKKIAENASMAYDIAIMSYNETKERFKVGKTDISSFSLAISRQMSALENYYTAIMNYWLTYYKIRKLTLFDFQRGVELGE